MWVQIFVIGMTVIFYGKKTELCSDSTHLSRSRIVDWQATANSSNSTLPFTLRSGRRRPQRPQRRLSVRVVTYEAQDLASYTFGSLNPITVTIFRKRNILLRYFNYSLTRALVGGGLFLAPLKFFRNISYTNASIVAKLSVPSCTSILRMVSKGKHCEYDRMAANDVRVTSCFVDSGQKIRVCGKRHNTYTFEDTIDRFSPNDSE